MTRSSVEAELRTVSRYCFWSGRQRRRREQLRHPQDAVHRRPDLVAHVGDELALGAARRFRRLLRLQQVVRLRGDALAQDDHPGQRQDDDAGEDADEAQGAAGVPERRGLQQLDAAVRSGPAAGTERTFRWMPPVANWTLQMPRTRSWLPGCSGASASGVVRASSIAANAVPLASRTSIGPSGVDTRSTRRASICTSCASAAPLAMRAGFSVSGATGARPRRSAGSARPRRSSCRRRRWRGSRPPRRRRRRARRACRTVRTSRAPVPSLR